MPYWRCFLHVKLDQGEEQTDNTMFIADTTEYRCGGAAHGETPGAAIEEALEKFKGFLGKMSVQPHDSKES